MNGVVGGNEEENLTSIVDENGECILFMLFVIYVERTSESMCICYALYSEISCDKAIFLFIFYL
jgi:hypothetical protein